MANDLKLVNMTKQDFASAKDAELFDVRWEKIRELLGALRHIKKYKSTRFNDYHSWDCV